MQGACRKEGTTTALFGACCNEEAAEAMLKPCGVDVGYVMHEQCTAITFGAKVSLSSPIYASGWVSSHYSRSLYLKMPFLPRRVLRRM